MIDRRLAPLWLIEGKVNPELMILGSHEFSEVLRVVGRKIESKAKVGKFPLWHRRPHAHPPKVWPSADGCDVKIKPVIQYYNELRTSG